MLQKRLSISQLKNDIYNRLTINNTFRNNIRILIIDDNEVPYIDALRGLLFNITYKNDIDNMMDIEPYLIIICDIKGVGRKFSSEKEGAAIIQNIKTLYPEKGVIAYSGGTFDISLNEYFSLADDIIQKGLDASDIASKIDNTIKKVLDPQRLWISVSKRLSEKGVGQSIISKVEKYYIESLQNNNINIFSNRIKSKCKDINITDIISSVSSIIQIILLLNK